MATRKKAEMSAAHKQAMSIGRTQGRIVRSYLEGLEATKPKRGRKRTRETVERRLHELDEDLPSAKALHRLELIQERMDLEAELDQFREVVDISSLEADFVKVAKDYSKRRGISYAAFRELGVSAAVLKRSGVNRSSKTR